MFIENIGNNCSEMILDVYDVLFRDVIKSGVTIPNHFVQKVSSVNHIPKMSAKTLYC